MPSPGRGRLPDSLPWEPRGSRRQGWGPNEAPATAQHGHSEHGHITAHKTRLEGRAQGLTTESGHARKRLHSLTGRASRSSAGKLQNHKGVTSLQYFILNSLKMEKRKEDPKTPRNASTEPEQRGTDDVGAGCVRG